MSKFHLCISIMNDALYFGSARVLDIITVIWDKLKRSPEHSSLNLPSSKLKIGGQKGYMIQQVCLTQGPTLQEVNFTHVNPVCR